ncbi:MAG: hypothetical protein QXI22_01525 [Sulfolobales archaeon]
MPVMIMQHGIYPRPRGLARAISRFSSGKMSQEDLERVYEKYTERFFKLLKGLGYDRFSDGMFRWDDIFNPLISGIGGVVVNGLRRFYDNNYFFRQPIVRGRISYGEPKISRMLAKSLSIARNLGIEPNRVSLSLAGPYTMATNALIETSDYDVEKFMRDYTEKVIYSEIEGSLKEGVVNIDLHEPSIAVMGGAKLDAVREIYEEIARNFPKARVWAIMYFGYNGEGVRMFREASTRFGNIGYVVDMVEAPESAWNGLGELLGVGGIGIAIINSRTTKMERYRDIASKLLKALGGYEGDLYLTHNASLEFLPEKIAVRKLRLLRRFAIKINRDVQKT